MTPPSTVLPGEARKLSAVAHALAAPKPVGLKSKLRRGQARKKARGIPAPKLYIEVKDLRFHPLLKRVGLLPDLIAREEKLGKAQGKSRGAHKAAAEEMGHDFAALVESIRKHGIRERIKVLKTPKGWQIVDGRHRYEAAKEVIHLYGKEANEPAAQALAAHGLPCEEVAEADVVPIIMDAVNRRHLSKGARAYLAVLMFPEAAKEAAKRIKAGTPSAFSAEGLAREAGVSPRLIEDAIGLYHAFAEREDVRQRFEPAIWVGAGLAKLRAGIKGFLTTGEDPDEEPETEEQAKKRIAMERVETALQKWVGVTTAFKTWETIPLASRETITTAGVETILALPSEVRAALYAALLKQDMDQFSIQH